MDAAAAITSVLDEVTIKSRPQDFCVTEAVALGPSLTGSRRNPGYRYVRLRKSGYTTFQSIEAAAAFFGLEPGQVTYCGLKDEDAVTDQMIAFPGATILKQLPAFNRTYASGERFMQLVPYGRYPDPLTVGGLAGNAFRIRIRGMRPELAASLGKSGQAHPISVVNFYDTQRFGVPGGPKTTHAIGAALLADDHDAAFGLLKKAKTPESEKARNWPGTPQTFFGELEPRVTAFFMSADSSFTWNRTVNRMLEERLQPERRVSYVRDGFDFVTAMSPENLTEALSRTATVEYRRYRPEAGGFTSTAVARPTLIHTVVAVDGIEPDETHTDRTSAVVSFFLPSGAYATNVINQLLLFFSGDARRA